MDNKAYTGKTGGNLELQRQEVEKYKRKNIKTGWIYMQGMPEVRQDS